MNFMELVDTKRKNMYCKLKNSTLEFIQWTGQNVEELPEWVTRSGVRIYQRYSNAPLRLIINEECDYADEDVVCMKDYILKDEYGTLKIVDSHYFETKYDVTMIGDGS